jgi:hypothetical protein
MTIVREGQDDSNPPVRAISICIYDPSGKDAGKTYPEGSVWMADKERKQLRAARPIIAQDESSETQLGLVAASITGQPEPLRKILPQPDSDTEEHTPSLSELDDLAVYVAARSWRREQTPEPAQLDAETKQVTDAGSGETRGGLIDTDNQKSPSGATENIGVTSPTFANLTNRGTGTRC